MEYLKIYTDFVMDMEALGDAERGRLFTAMLNYAADGTEPDFRGNECIVWPTAKKHIDRAFKSNEKRIISSRENGKKGGRPKKEEPNKTQENPVGFEKPKKRHINTNTNTNSNTNRSFCGGGEMPVPTGAQEVGEKSPVSAANAAAHQLAMQYFGRTLSAYELQEVLQLVQWHCEDSGVPFDDGQAELLLYAFQAAAEAGSPSLSYLRGVYQKYRERGICTPEDYLNYEYERDEAGKGRGK